MEKPQVFISHSDGDAEWARAFAKALKDRGVTVWLDEFEIGPGESVADAMEAGLRGSEILVPLLDTGSDWMPTFYFELGAAIGMRKRLLPIVPRDLDPSVLPKYVRVHGYLIRSTPESAAEELSNTLQAA